MKDNGWNYLMAGLFLLFGSLIQFDLYKFSDFQMFYLNFGALFLSISALAIASRKFRKITIVLKVIRNTFLGLAFFAILIAILGLGFKHNDLLIKFSNSMDNTSFLLFGISIGLFSNLLNNRYMENKRDESENEIRRLKEETIKDKERMILEIEKYIIRTNSR